MNMPEYQYEEESHLTPLLDELLQLRANIIQHAEERLARVSYSWPDKDCRASAMNLCMYLAFRRYDNWPLQKKLSQLGMSSLGRGESNILDNIDRVIGLLSQVTENQQYTLSQVNKRQNNFVGNRILAERNQALFGKSYDGEYTHIMTTLPSEASHDEDLINNLINNGTSVARINCAHDDSKDWNRMVDLIHSVAAGSSKECRIFMDLAGMKIRTGNVATKKKGKSKVRLFEGEVFEIRCDAKASVPSSINPMTNEFMPAIIACSTDAILDQVKVNDAVWIDDGKLGSVIEARLDNGLRLRVTHAGPKGVSIKADKGLNFPDSTLNLPTLTKKDLKDLDFVCRHADIVGVSFVQTADDLEQVMAELNRRNCLKPVVAKIETHEAVKNLPEIILKGLSYPGRFAIMIARGDLAVELGSVRLAETQEEILWLCEAAHIPVIWATQVLESLAKKGIVSRPEITDAAMSVRAECVMLNKGKYIISALVILRNIINRMQTHQYKKVSRLSALRW